MTKNKIDWVIHAIPEDNGKNMLTYTWVKRKRIDRTQRFRHRRNLFSRRYGCNDE